MTLRRSLLLTLFALVVGLLCVPGASGQSNQQYVDDGYFEVYVYASASSDGTVSASASGPEPSSNEDYDSYFEEGQPTWSVSGGNYQNSGQGSSFSTGPVPLGDSYDVSFEFLIQFYYEDPTAGGEFDGGCEQYIDGQTCGGTDSLVADIGLYLPAPPPPPPNACAVSSNQAAGFTSIVPSGITSSISGTFSVSFGGGDFAGITPPQVNYGPSSTPESIAASMASLVTRSYLRYGLSAKAFGSNVIYSGRSITGSGSVNLGSVTNVFSGNGGSSSFLANSSPAAAAGAEMACENAPSSPSNGAPVYQRFTATSNCTSVTSNLPDATGHCSYVCTSQSPSPITVSLQKLNVQELNLKCGPLPEYTPGAPYCPAQATTTFTMECIFGLCAGFGPRTVQSCHQ